jgi:hypothetical protein
MVWGRLFWIARWPKPSLLKASIRLPSPGPQVDPDVLTLMARPCTPRSLRNATKLARDLTTALAVKDTAHEAKPGTSAGNQASR